MAELPRTPGKRQPAETAVILDVDGVLSPVHGRTAWHDDVEAGNVFGPVLVSPALCARLERLATLPGVLQCAAIGIPDEKSGEAIKLFVVPKPGESLSKEQVMEHMRANVTGYKVPKAVEFREALPTTNVGKILRRELRDEELKKMGKK